MSMSGVGFDIGAPPDPELVDLMERAIAELPDDQRRYQVRIRSMLTSVLVPDPNPVRRTQLAAEALAIAEEDGASELIASAHLARRLALAGRDDLTERTEMALTAVRQAESTPNVQLMLTTMLFAMSDLLESGRMEEHLAMLDTFSARASDLHLPLFEVYARFIERLPRAVGRSVRRSPTSRRRRPGVRCPLPRAQRRGHPRRDRLPAGARHRAAGRPPARDRAAGRSQPTPAAVADRPRPHARRSRGVRPRRRASSPRWSTSTVSTCGTTRCSSRRCAPSSTSASCSATGRGPRSCSAPWRRTTTGSPSPGWRASRWARSAGTPDAPPMPPAISTRPRSCSAKRSPPARRWASGPTKRWHAPHSPTCSATSTAPATAPRRTPRQRRRG